MPDAIPSPPPGYKLDTPIPPPPAGYKLDSPEAEQKPQSAIRRIGQAAKTIGQQTAVQGAGMAPLAAGAGAGAGIGGVVGGPPGALIGGALGAGIGGLAIPAFEYAASKIVGLERPEPTYSEAGKSAAVGAAGQMGLPIAIKAGLPILESIFSIKPGLTAATEAGTAAETANVEAEKTAQESAAKLQTKQGDIRAEQVQKLKSEIVKAQTEHAGAVADAEKQITTAKEQLFVNRMRDAEQARTAAAEQIGQKQAQRTIDKTSAQLTAEEAQGTEARAAARSNAVNPVFDASARFHEEVGAKFEPYIGKIKDDPVAPNAIESIGGRLTGVERTLEERGQRIESPELRKIITQISGGVATELPETLEVGGRSLSDIRKENPSAAARIEAQLKASKAASPENMTYGQLWGLRARANRVLSAAKNPADRWAAREVVDEINNAIPGVPAEIRQQYAYERTMAKGILGKVANAQNPQEVGQAIFGSKNAPESAEVPLTVIRFTRQYAPEQMDGLRQAFADRYLGNKMDANDLGKLNPNVLKELYGNNADSVIRILGPEGNVKQASWNQLIQTDPEAKTMLTKAIQDGMTKQSNLELQEAVANGEKALRELPPKYEYVRQAFARAKTAPQKLSVLAEKAPQPEQVDIPAAMKEAFKKGVRQVPRVERYGRYYLGFRTAFALAGGEGMVAQHPGVALVAGLMLGGRAGVRTLLGTELGATVAMKLLDIPATKANVGSFGRGLAALLSTTLIHHMNDNPTP